MNFEMVKDVRYREIGLSIAILVMAIGVGLMARNWVLLFAVCVISIVGFLFFSGIISFWGLSLILIGIGVSLGRLYLVLGPNPLNSGRMQQAGLIGLLGLLLFRHISWVKSGVAPKVKFPPFVLLGLGIYFALHILNAVINSTTIRDIESFRSSLEGMFFAPMAFFIAFLSFRGDKNTGQFLWLCFGIGILQAGLAFIQILFPVQFYEWVQRISPNPNLTVNTYLITNRVYGIWTHAPEFGGLMAGFIPAGIYFAWGSINVIKRIAAITGLVILFSALLASASVTPIMTCFLFTLLMIWLRSKESIFRKVIGIVALILVGAVVLLLLSSILQVSLDQLPIVNRLTLDPTIGLTLESSLGSRLIIYQAGVNLWLNNFWLGVGVGQFQLFQKSALDLTAHSVYLQTLAENGVVGAFGLLMLIASQAWLDAQLWKRMNHSEKNLYLPIILIFIIILTVSIFDFTFNSWNFQLLFWFSQGIVLGKYNSVPHRAGNLA